jgi:hypothetical protein
MKEFQIERIVENVWKGITAGPNSYLQAQTEIISSIDRSNALLLSYYQGINSKVRQFK